MNDDGRMSHDTHFLTRLERLSPRQTEWAISLYRNVSFVKEIVAMTAPADAQRVAIAIENAPGGAHVLVERDGHFVTCLGAGMKHDLPVITRAAVEQSRKGREMIQTVLATAGSRASREAFVHLLLSVGGPRLCREDAVELRAWAPALPRFFVDEHTRWLRQFGEPMKSLAAVENFKKRHLPLLRQQWGASWAMGHLGPICCEAVRQPYSMMDPTPDAMRTHYAVTGLLSLLAGAAVRACWAVADLGYAVIDDLETAYSSPGMDHASYATACALVIVGLREPSLHERVSKIMARDFVRDDPFDEQDTRFLSRLRQVFAHPEEALLRQHERARAWAAKALPGVHLDDREVLAAKLYDTRALVEDTDEIELADMLPFAAASSHEDLYLPRHVLAQFPPEDLDADAWAFGAAIRPSAPEPEKPAKAPVQPGRNQPCHCGSGRKFKKCHGA